VDAGREAQEDHGQGCEVRAESYSPIPRLQKAGPTHRVFCIARGAHFGKHTAPMQLRNLLWYTTVKIALRRMTDLNYLDIEGSQSQTDFSSYLPIRL
jgi:hypothetical protein